MTKMIDSLAREFEREAQTTRRHLERLPEDKMGWRPHEKSFTAGGLGSHIVDSIGWAVSIINLDEFDIDPATYKFYQAESRADLLKAFDERVADCSRVLAGADDDSLTRTWRMTVMGRLQLERNRGDVFRDFILSHLIHHRGQFSVYLRLLDVPVPGSYGPTADEQS
jgi:uncharacterized damage-inducible protein DinB